MKKQMISIFCLLLALFLLAGCTSVPLPEGLSEEEVTEKAETAISFLNERKYDEVIGLFREDLQDASSANDWADIFDPLLDELGPFEAFSQTAVSGMEENEELFAVAVVQCKYQNGLKTYSVSFDQDGELVGLYITA